MYAALVAGKRTRAGALAAASSQAGDADIRCLSCDAPAYYGGKNSPLRGTYFAHSPSKPGEPADRCTLHSRNERRFAWLKDSARDAVAGEQLRSLFLEDGPLRQAFAFCLRALNSKPAMNAEVFAGLVMVADGLDLWSVPGQNVATISMLLLSLEDIRSQTKDGREIWYRYELQKPRGVKEVCLVPGECRLSKHFVNRDGTTGPLLTRGQNHLVALSAQEFERVAGRVDWVSPGTLVAIRRRANHQLGSSAALTRPEAARPAPTAQRYL